MTCSLERTLIVAAAALLACGYARGQCELLDVSGLVGDELGRSVDVSGNWLVASQGTTARVFRRTGILWREAAVLSMPYRVFNVAIDGDVIVAGTLHMAGTPQTYIYRFDGAAWLLEDAWELGAHQTAWGGRSVDVSGNVIVIGDQGQDRIWVMRHVGGNWLQEFSNGGGGEYGAAVAVDQNLLIVGAPQQFGDGRAWIYRYTGVTWMFDGMLGAGADEDISGHHVDIKGDLALVGHGGRMSLYRYTSCQFGPWCLEAEFADSSNGALHGNTAAIVGLFSALNLYQPSGGLWQTIDVLSASGIASGDELGHSLALDGQTVVAGAPYSDDAGTSSGTLVAFPRGATFVDGGHAGTEHGTCALPFNSVQEGLSVAPTNGLLVITAGTYAAAPATLNQPVRVAPSGGVVRIE